MGDSSRLYVNAIGKFSNDFSLKADTIIISKSGKEFTSTSIVGRIENDTMKLRLNTKTTYLLQEKRFSGLDFKIESLGLSYKKPKKVEAYFKSDKLVILSQMSIKINNSNNQ